MNSFWSTKMECSVHPLIQPAHKPRVPLSVQDRSRVGNPQRALRQGIVLCFLICVMGTITVHSLTVPMPLFFPHHTCSLLCHFWEINCDFSYF